MFARDRFEERLARVSWQRLVFSLIAPTASGSFFFVANLVGGHIGWAIVFATLFALEVVLVAWWILAKGRGRGDAHTFRNALDPPSSSQA